MRILILEDSDERVKKFKSKLIGSITIITKDTKECIDLLKNNGPWDYIFLDHDLGGEVFSRSGDGTGYEVAEWIANNKTYAPAEIIIHSLNEAGANSMGSILKDHGIKSSYVPFLWDKIKLH